MAKTDLYRSFKELSEKEAGADYQIIATKRNSGVAVIAPHGGFIEFATAEIAQDIAADNFSLYAFEARKRKPPAFRGNVHPLHITSHNFDEPQCVAIVEAAKLVIALHGKTNRGGVRRIEVGGNNRKLATVVASALTDHGFHVAIEGLEFSGTNPMNICNRGQGIAGGIQLEVPAALRTTLITDKKVRAAFVESVRLGATIALEQEASIKS